MSRQIEYKYRIQTRRFSSNVIERGHKREGGKWHWEVCLCPTVFKKEGDPIADRMLKVLQTPIES